MNLFFWPGPKKHFSGPGQKNTRPPASSGRHPPAWENPAEHSWCRSQKRLPIPGKATLPGVREHIGKTALPGVGEPL